MAGFRTVLALLLLGLIEVNSTKNQGLTFFDALTIAVTAFNEKTTEEHSFWLWAVEPQPEWNNTSRKPHYLSFAAKETQCLKVENLTPITCPFKENAKEKYCQAIIQAFNEKQAQVLVSCEPVASDTLIPTKKGIEK